MINNGFTNLQFDEELDKFERRRNEQNNELPNINSINIYYKNQMSPAYKVDERVLKSIVKRNIKSKLDDDTVNLIVYYKKYQNVQFADAK